MLVTLFMPILPVSLLEPGGEIEPRRRLVDQEDSHLPAAAEPCRSPLLHDGPGRQLGNGRLEWRYLGLVKTHPQL